MPFFPQFSNLFVPPYVPPVAGKILWLKADVGVNYDGNNLVTSWEDQSGNANDVTPYSSGYEPLWVDNSINGLPTIRFYDTEPSLLVTGNIFSVNYDTPASLIAVAMAVDTEVSIGDAQRWLLPDGSSGTFELGFTFGAYGAETARNFASMAGRNLIEEADIQSSQIVDTEVAIVSLINDGTTVSFYKNGSLEGTIDPADFDNATASSGVWGIGAQMAGGSIYLTAKFNLAELMIYNTSIDTIEREAQEAYLNDKWSVY